MQYGTMKLWSSARDWTPKEKEQLQHLLSEAKTIQQQNQATRGAPALLFLSTSGGKRPKRRVAWGIIVSGKADSVGNIKVGCSEKEILDVPASAIQPVEVRG